MLPRGLKKQDLDTTRIHEIALFINAAPKYDTDHVFQIEKYCFERGIPFCVRCNDWHHEDELCTTITTE